MRLDHIAYRTRSRYKTSTFLQRAFGYEVAEEFFVDFGDGTRAECIAHSPRERVSHLAPWVIDGHDVGSRILDKTQVTRDPYLLARWMMNNEYHAPPEIFVSDGERGSIVGDWVASRNGGKGGIHHMAYQTGNIRESIQNWKELGVEFLSEEPMSCPGLLQIFTTEHELTGVTYELIQREGEGGKAFCKENVKNLMESTKANL
jgi:catechol 2,3-dioxygenase-like lactoylglutathione lyase family enzyme